MADVDYNALREAMRRRRLPEELLSGLAPETPAADVMQGAAGEPTMPTAQPDPMSSAMPGQDEAGMIVKALAARLRALS